jgi:hypothetical protein
VVVPQAVDGRLPSRHIACRQPCHVVFEEVLGALVDALPAHRDLEVTGLVRLLSQ